jgi:SAM-dependent methyltransferase
MYQRRAVDDFLAGTPSPLLASGVLEIGSDADGRVLRELVARGAARVVGVNPELTPVDVERVTATLPPGSRVEALDLLSSGLPADSFGAIFSVAVFEHLGSFERCLAEMHRLLIPGGQVYAAFGPIWSSSLGHHVTADADGIHLQHDDPRRNPIEDHSHLLISPDDMRSRIAARHTPAVADAAVRRIYEADTLSRLFFEEYVAAFEASPFRVLRLVKDEEQVPAARLVALRATYPGRTVFNVRNAVVVLQKPADRRGAE